MSASRVGGLFAGYGGLERALHDVLGAEPAWFSEFDKAPSAILAHRWPGVPNHGDVTKIKWTPDCPECGEPTALYWIGADAHRAYWCHEHGEFDLSIRLDQTAATGVPIAEPVDIIAGGSPCQDLSTAGKRKGMRAGTRSGLWASMCDAIDIIRPSLVVWENVRGALSADAHSDMEPCAGCVGGGDDGPVLRALGRVLGDLAELGYDAAWTGLRAADVGAPHGRFRIFVLAWPAASDADAERPGERPRDGRGHVGHTTPLDLADAAPDTDRLGHEWGGDARDGGARPADGDSDAAGRLTLLPTPTAQQNESGLNPGGNLSLHGAILGYDEARATRLKAQKNSRWGSIGASTPPPAAEPLTLLPTPTASPSEHGQETSERRAIGTGPRSTSDAVLALLPTPTCRDQQQAESVYASGAPTLVGALFGINARDAARMARLYGASTPPLSPEPLTLLPTPVASDANDRNASEHWHGNDLVSTVKTLLPTPRASDGPDASSHGRTWSKTDRSLHTIVHTEEIAATDFGQYAPAIARWEAITRSAPSPTEPTGKSGAGRLSPAFVEWLMGLPDGWVTDVGISRNNQLKALGNGVVPQQAAAAIRYLLGVREHALRMAKAVTL